MNDDQLDEKEVLDSIYEDDENFKPLTNISYCYKFICDENELKSFMLQINWPLEYPEGVGAEVRTKPLILLGDWNLLSLVLTF